MGRNQIDLLLLLSFMLVGSLFYNKNLKEQLAITKDHYINAQAENRSKRLDKKYQLMALAESFPEYRIEALRGIDMARTTLFKSNSALNEQNLIQRSYKNIIGLSPFTKLNPDQFESAEKLYEHTIDIGLTFFKELKKKQEQNVEFSILLKDIEEHGNNLRLKIFPFQRQHFSKENLYAITDTDSIIVKGPDFTYCKNIHDTYFASKNKLGELTPVKAIHNNNSINSRP